MPILALGTYTAVAGGADGTLATSSPVEFTYVPLNLGVWLVGIAFFAAGVLSLRAASAYSGAKYIVLLPFVVGVVLVMVDNEYTLFSGIPLQILTVLFLVWRWLRVRNVVRSVFQIIILCIVLTAVNFLSISEIYSAPLFLRVIYPLVLGVCIAWPLVTLRIAVRRQVTWKRLTAGLMFGAPVVIGILAFALGIFGYAPWWVWLLTAAVFFFPALLFSALIRWNAWARDVVTGNPDAFAPRSQASSLSSDEAPAPG
jgi:hypothetical protein